MNGYPLITMFDYVIYKHRKIFVFRFDLRLKKYLEPKELSYFFDSLNKGVRAQYGTRLFYFWVREQSTSMYQHYHAVVFMNGSVVHRGKFLKGLITKLWFKHGSCHCCKRYHNVQRKDQRSIDNASEHISYLAKNRDKEKNPPASKNFGHSRFPKK